MNELIESLTQSIGDGDWTVRRGAVEALGNIVIDHYMRVNECTEGEFIGQRELAFNKYRERSQHEWKTEFKIDIELLESHRR